MGDLFNLDLHLLAQYLIPYLPPVSAIVGPPPQHEFVGNDSCGVVVDRERMVLPAHDLRGHVAWGPTRVAAVVRLHSPCDSQVRDPEVAAVIED